MHTGGARPFCRRLGLTEEMKSMIRASRDGKSGLVIGRLWRSARSARDHDRGGIGAFAGVPGEALPDLDRVVPTKGGPLDRFSGLNSP
jgi:hypothetical protein